MIRWTLVTHHVPFQAGELGLFGEAIGHALMEGGLVWVLYLAVEPWVRRRWPQTLVTWSRVLAGRFRDPLVGRDILLSVLFGLGYLVVIEAVDYASARTGNSPPSPERFVGGLMGLRYILGMYVTHAELAIQAGPGLLLQIFLLRVLLKKEWLAAAGFVLFWTCSKALGSANPMFDVPLLIFVYVFLVVILMRYGLFALTLTAFLLDGTSPQLRTLDLTAWYGLSSTVAILVVLGLAFYGFHTSLGGRKLFGDGLLNR
jgi:serine/threonine-protein kinase